MPKVRHCLAGLLAPWLLASGAPATPAAAQPPADYFGVRVLPSAEAARGQVGARFMGTTTLLFDDGESQILVDGFFTRPRRLRMLLGRVRPDWGVIERELGLAEIHGRLRAVLVSHSHYDHALDSATVVALRPSSVLVGSLSTANLGFGAGLAPERMLISGPGRQLDFGRFHVTLFAALHSWPDRFPGLIEAPMAPRAHISRFREGGSLAFVIERDGLTLLVHPVANFLPGTYRDVRADIVFLAVGQLGRRDRAFAENYWCEVVRETRARLVIPVHWDEFTRPLDAGLTPPPSPLDRVERAMTWVRAMAGRDGIALAMMPVREPVDLRAALPPPPPVWHPGAEDAASPVACGDEGASR